MNEEVNQDNLPIVEEDVNVVEYEGGNLDKVNPNDIVARIESIAGNICDTVTSWKTMDMKMHEMDVQLKAFLGKMDFDLAKYRVSVPVVEKQLNFVNEQIAKILDAVLIMQADTESEMKMKMRMLDTSENYLDKLSSMMIKLL